MKKNKSINKRKKDKKVNIEEEDSIGKKTDALNVENIEVITDATNEAVEDDEVTVYRDIMTMTDDERFSSDDHTGLSAIRLSPPPPPAWYDDPKKLKFRVGQLVVMRGVKDPVVNYVSGPAKRENYYTIIPNKSLKDITVHQDDIKLAPREATWTKYWDTIPVIKAPSWNTKQSSKDVKKLATKRTKKK